MKRTMNASLIAKMWAAALALAMMLALVGCASGEPTDANAGGDAATTPTTEQGTASAADQASSDKDAIKVAVTLTPAADAGVEPKTIEVDVPAGATVLDALEATGWEVQASDSEYGKFVEAINGIENGSSGDASGWVFEVNGESVMEGCDSKTLADGDTVEWKFFVG